MSITLILGITRPNPTFAATNPGLGAAETFSIIAQTAITGTGTISGDVGLNNTGAGITALTAGDVGGTIYSTNGVAPGLEILDPAVQANLSTANDNISGQGSNGSIGPVLDGLTLTTGVYDIGAGRLNGGVLTLDGPGIYIFRASSDLVSSGSINFINGARACDVYWKVNTLATINGSSFAGTIIAGTGVHFGANVTLNGRALALGGDVTLLNNTISGPTCAAPAPTPAPEPAPAPTPAPAPEPAPAPAPAPAPTPATLHVVKTVINDNGGTAVASDFNLHVKLSGNDVTGSPTVGTIAPGTSYSLSANTYVISEDANASYTQSFSGDCNSNGSVTLSDGDNKTCTVTNNDIAEVVIPSPTAAPIIPAPVSTPMVPKLPNTGIAPDENSSAPWNIIIPAGIFTILLSLYIIQKKQTV
ncbi:MAG: DUF3494 domain-containing protein [Candidatus Magasanikbacteria bacterium]|nr:DUF3494 domain-containing protein [Candidatus Magasanikbacteria bacterium]